MRVNHSSLNAGIVENCEIDRETRYGYQEAAAIAAAIHDNREGVGRGPGSAISAGSVRELAWTPWVFSIRTVLGGGEELADVRAHRRGVRRDTDSPPVLGTRARRRRP